MHFSAIWVFEKLSDLSYLPIRTVGGERFHVVIDIYVIDNLLLDVLTSRAFEDVLLVEIRRLLMFLTQYLVHCFEMRPVGINGANAGSSLHGPLYPMVQAFQIPDPGLDFVGGSVKSTMLHIGCQ